jgi:hypothetical protein
MGVYGSNQVGFICVDGYNVLGQITTVTDEVDAMLELNHALGDAWQKSAFVGLSKFAISQKGFFNDAAGSVDAVFGNVAGGLGALRVICYCLEGNTIGKHFEGFEGAGENSYKRLPALGALLKAEVGFFSGGGQRDSGVILHALGAETGATGDTKATPVDSANDTRVTQIPITSASKANPCVVTTDVPHGLATNDVVLIAGNSLTGTVINGSRVVTVTGTNTFTVPVNTSGSGGAGTGGSLIRLNSNNGGVAYLQVTALALGGYTDFAPLVLHSSDNVTYTTLATFAVVTAAPKAQRLVVAAGTLVKEYLACSWAYDGTGSGQSVTFFIGFARG